MLRVIGNELQTSGALPVVFAAREASFPEWRMVSIRAFLDCAESTIYGSRLTTGLQVSESIFVAWRQLPDY